MKLYKYQKINKFTIAGLIQKTLWKADPRSFNDPFELRLMQLSEDEIDEVEGFDLYLENLSKQNPYTSFSQKTMLLKDILKKLQDDYFNFRVISFSEVYDSILMWAHHAEDHKGMCLGFSLSEEEGESVIKVNYNDDYPKINLGQIWSVNGLSRILLNKSLCWSHEKEWRQIFVKNDYDQLSPYPGKLVEVILGWRVSREDQSLIYSILTGQDVLIKNATLHPKKYKVQVLP